MSNALLITLVSLLFALILSSAFFSAAETAYSSVSKSKIEREAKKGKKTALLIKKHYNSFGWTLATILICNNLVNISSSALMTFMFTKLMGATGMVTIISTFVLTPIIVIFGEITPKLLAKKYSYGYLSKIVYLLEAFNFILFPITYPLSKIALQSKVTNSELELKDLISIAKKEGVLDVNEATLASKALDLDSKIVSKIMVKRKDIISVNEDTTIKDALSLFRKHGISRIPVTKDGKYIGIVILKDIFLEDHNDVVRKYVIEIISVSKHTLATKALEQMRLAKAHMALVSERTDSNKFVGLLTIEDIIEELVGEIYDEHDDDLKIREIAHYKWIVVGQSLMTELSSEIRYKFENSDDEISVKQWLQSRINRKIKNGLTYVYKDKIKFKVISNKNNEDTIFEVTKK